jgi:YHS domain-containing protein
MNSISNLRQLIDAETSAQEDKIRRLQQMGLESFEQRRKRYKELFLPALQQFSEVWSPRLNLLAEKFQCLAHRFGDGLQVTPAIKPNAEEPHSGEMTFICDSTLARIRLNFSFFHDVEIRRLVLDYDLEIIPVFLKFEPHIRLEQPLDALHLGAVAGWLDDRILSFVRTYLAIHENSSYLADHLVEDPIAGVRFPKFAAKTTLESDGATYYFISRESKNAFQNQIQDRRSGFPA